MANYVAESIPQDTLRDLLENNWVQFKETPKPAILVVNDPENPYMRHDLMNSGDIITIYAGGPEVIKYRGNVRYYDRNFPIMLEIWTKESRQRLRDMWKQVKGIVFDHLFGFEGYQLIRIKGYTEMVNQEMNIWRSQIRLNVESAGVTIDTNGDFDRYNP
jgi:hypothetical protein